MFNSIFKSVTTGIFCLTSTLAMANYPDKPITLVVGFSAGGGTDVMARNVAPFLEKYLGDDATIVVKNMPGASGQIGITEVAHSDPDGYTIGTYNLPGMMARTLDRDANYSADSFTFLANIVNDPNVIVTSKKGNIDSLQKLIETVKGASRPMPIGMSSLGGDDHLGLIKFESLTDTNFNIIPFKGSSAARTAVLGGHVKAAVLNISEVTEFKDELNIIGLSQSERSEFDPSIATFKEQGVNFINGAMRGFVAPAGLPEDVKTKLLDAFAKLAKDPEFLAKMKSTANPVSVSLGDDFKELNAETLKLAQDVWEKTPWK
ncbi:tripartite tricarboxylate transporter substrate binding protein [Vibrio mytili]|uniref:Receptor n=1 Tax=Vibrio mytili TaxID=50718 RepID=A0A0C3I4C2_9VIBR|nr:tripartite tricarboxylate transporter substrate binding protein [Vibrio mytili]KIN09177.1 receptor [Vibrio mytili]